MVCSGANPRQVQAIADEVDEKLSATGVEPAHREGYNQADWVLLDYVDFVVHIFSESARKFYDLERLWKTATRLQLADLEKPARKPAARKTAASAKRAKAAKSARKSGVSELPARAGPADCCRLVRSRWRLPAASKCHAR